VIGWMQTNTTGETILEKVIVKQIAWANNGVLTGDHPALHTTSTDNDMEMKREEQQMMLHRMAMAHNVLDLWSGRQNIAASQKESRTQINKWQP
jgi:hypothetical protein